MINIIASVADNALQMIMSEQPVFIISSQYLFGLFYIASNLSSWTTFYFYSFKSENSNTVYASDCGL